MLRALFLALGATSCILGFEALAIEKAVLKESRRANAAGETRVVQPPDWAPWSLMAGGAVVMLYSFTIPPRFNG
jgi:hypothetical protein